MQMTLDMSLTSSGNILIHETGNDEDFGEQTYGPHEEIDFQKDPVVRAATKFFETTNILF